MELTDDVSREKQHGLWLLLIEREERDREE